MNISSVNPSTQLRECIIAHENLFAPSSLGKVSVTYDGHNFFVIDENQKKIQLERAFLPKELRGISSTTLEKCLGASYLVLNKASDASYSLALRGRLVGGGPLSGFIGYWGTKLVCYGSVATLAATATVATGGVATGILATTGATVTTCVTAGALVQTAEMVGGAGTIAAAVAAVESASTTVGTALFFCPFLP